MRYKLRKEWIEISNRSTMYLMIQRGYLKYKQAQPVLVGREGCTPG